MCEEHLLAHMILLNEKKTVTSEEVLPKVAIEIKFTKTSNMNVPSSFLLHVRFCVIFAYYRMCTRVAIDNYLE